MAAEVSDISSFGTLLKRGRLAAGLTQEALAERAGVSAKAVGELERDPTRTPRLDTVTLLADALQLAAAERESLMAAARPDQLPPAAPLTAERSRRALPRPLTSMFGRAGVTAAVAELLRRGDVPLLTLTGPGGVGKTRLALAVAEEIEPTFTEGVAFVGLAHVRDPALVPAAVASAVGVPDRGARPLRESLINALGERKLLLVLDNCEHVLDAAPLVADLLQQCPRLRVLATSRAPLGLAGERLWVVAPLALPLDGLPGPDFGPAVSLFEARTQAVAPDFRLDEANAATIVAICRHLDGLPLAIELAAARARFLAPGELLARLEQSLPLLTGGPRDAPSRLRTMRNAIAWSHDLLDASERVMFRRLSIFTGGFGLDAAMSVAGSGELPVSETNDDASGVDAQQATWHGQPAVLDLLGSLIDQSLVQRGEGSGFAAEGEATRYLILESIRAYALEQLAASGEEAAIRDRHATWCLALAEQAEPKLSGAQQTVWFDRLEAEHPNLRAAQSWLLEQGDAERGLRLATALSWFWSSRSYFREARTWLETFLAMPTTAPTRGRGLLEAATILHWQGDYEKAAAYADEALAIFQAHGDQLNAAYTLRRLGSIALDRGDLDRAAPLLTESGELLRPAGTAWHAAYAIYLAGCLAVAAGQSDTAVGRFAEAAAAFRAIGDRDYVAAALGQLGAAIGTDNLPAARAAYAESLTLAFEVKDQTWVAWALIGAAQIAHVGGEHATAARLLAAATTIREAIGEHRLPQTALSSAVRSTLGEERFASEWSYGSSLPETEVIAEARAILVGDDHWPHARPESVGTAATAAPPPLPARPEKGKY